MDNQEEEARISAAILVQRKIRHRLNKDRKQRLKLYKLQIKRAKEEITWWLSQDEDKWQDEDARCGYDSGLFRETIAFMNKTEVRTPRCRWD